jgi:hypothetical protein
MKRVHGWNPESPNPSSPPRDGPPPVTRKGAGRKRKSTAEDSAPRRKAKLAEPKPAAPTAREVKDQKRKQLLQTFSTKKQRLIELLSAVGGPDDVEHMTKDQLQYTMDEMFDAALAHKECSG